jgi:hypothetical protein
MDSIAVECGVVKARSAWLSNGGEDILVKDGAFTLPGEKALRRESLSARYIVADVTKSPINHPKEGRNAYYPGKSVMR